MILGVEDEPVYDITFFLYAVCCVLSVLNP